MCVAGLECLRKRLGKLVDLNLVGIKLRRVDPRVPQERPERGDVAAALAQHEAAPSRHLAHALVNPVDVKEKEQPDASGHSPEGEQCSTHTRTSAMR